MCKVFSFDVVVGLDEDLSENGLADRIVFGVELVKPMEGVTVLVGERDRSECMNVLCRTPSHSL